MAAAFPITCLTPTNGVPTNVYLTILQREVNSNAMIIASTYEPVFRHLWLSGTPIAYAIYRAITYEVPINPGLVPTIPDEPTGPKITKANHQHLVLHHIYQHKIGLNDNDSYHEKITYTHDFNGAIIDTKIAY